MRTFARVALVVVALVALLLAAAVWLAEPLVRAGLRAAGAEVEFEELTLGPSRIEVAGLRIGSSPAQEIDRLSLDYRLPDLLALRAGTLTLEGARLQGRLGERGVEIAGLAEDGDGRASRLPPLPLPERLIVRDARIDLSTAFGLLQVPLEARVENRRARPGFSLAAENAALVQDDGELQASLRLEGSLAEKDPFDLAALSAEGTLELRASRLRLPELTRGIDGDGTLRISLSDGRLHLRTSDLDLRGAEPESGLDALRALLPAPWRLRAGNTDAPLELAAQPRAEDLEVTIEGPVVMSGASAELAATTTSSLILSRDLELRAVRPQALALHGRNLAFGDLKLTDIRFEVAAEGEFSDLRGSVRVELRGDGRPTPDLVLSGLVLEQRLAFSRSPSRLALSLEPGGTVQLDRLVWDGRLEAEAPRLALAPATEPLLVVEAEGGRITAWRHALRAHVDPIALRLIATKPLPLEAGAEDVRLTLTGDGDGLRQGRIVLGDGRVVLPAQQLSFAGIGMELEIDGAGLTPGQVAPITVAAISQVGEPALFRPVNLQVKLRPAPGSLAFDGRITDPSDRVDLSFQGTHDPARGDGESSVELASLSFSPGILQPADLLPGLGRHLRQVSGQIDGSGRLTWGGAGLDGNFEVLIEDLNLSTGPARLEQVNGLLRFDRLWPLTTPPHQQVSAALLDIGLPLRRAFMTFQLEPDNRMAVQQLRSHWAGGTLRAEPFSLGSDGSAISFMLRAEGLALADILEQVRLVGLTGEGRISGQLPITIVGNEALITGGELQARGPGWLRYRPGGAPDAFGAGGEGMDLLLQALENFRYEELRITLDGRTDSDMDIGLHIKGANPDLYDGHPIDFNLSLEGELANILRSGLRSYQLPERIREQMERGAGR